MYHYDKAIELYQTTLTKYRQIWDRENEAKKMRERAQAIQDKNAKK